MTFPVYSSATVSAVIYAPGLYLMVLAGGDGAHMAGAVGLFAALGFILFVMLCFLVANAFPTGGNCFKIVGSRFSHPAWPAFASVSMLCGFIVLLAVSVCCAAGLLMCIFPAVVHNSVLWALFLLMLLMLGNLRRAKWLRGLLTGGGYLFVLAGAVLILAGALTNYADPQQDVILSGSAFASGGPALAFKAFVFGLASLSGIVSVTEKTGLSGKEESPMTVLYVSSLITLCLFLGFSLLMAHRGILPEEGNMTIAMLCEAYMGKGLFKTVFMAAGILMLLSAANACFRDFPRLIAVLAEGQLAPRQMRNPGEAQTYSNGIALLVALASVSILALQGDISDMIPLLAVFLFSAFALMLFSASAAYYHEKQYAYLVLSLAGAAVIAALDVTFVLRGLIHGTLFALLFAALLTMVCCRIKKHYVALAGELRLTDDDLTEHRPYKTCALILTSGIHRGVLPAISYAKSISQDTRALFIAADPRETRGIKANWEKYAMGVPLVIMDSPMKNIVQPVLRYVKEARRERPGYMINIIIPEIVFRSYFSKLLHNKVALVLRLLLSFQKDVIVTHVSYYPEMERKGDTGDRPI
ncbi:MAG: hypothetical protein IJT95_04075 [Abditibacteriota bacterium]|nr:hypothetical protein [Abditibacteriota bacterium]